MRGLVYKNMVLLKQAVAILAQSVRNDEEVKGVRDNEEVRDVQATEGDGAVAGNAVDGVDGL